MYEHIWQQHACAAVPSWLLARGCNPARHVGGWTAEPQRWLTRQLLQRPPVGAPPALLQHRPRACTAVLLQSILYLGLLACVNHTSGTSGTNPSLQICELISILGTFCHAVAFWRDWGRPIGIWILVHPCHHQQARASPLCHSAAAVLDHFATHIGRCILRISLYHLI